MSDSDYGYGKQIANKPGKQTLAAGEQPASVPGKQTLVERNLAQTGAVLRTGNAYADQGTACDARPNAAGCVLTGPQRGRVVSEYTQRVIAAQLQYSAALGELRVDELLKKEKTEPSIILDLLLDIVSAVAGGAVLRSMDFFLDGKAGKDALSLLVQDTDEAVKSIKEMSKENIDKVLDEAVDAGKEQLDSVKPPDSDKQATLTYLALLQNASVVTYQRIREDALAGISDGALLVLWRAFDARSGHTVSEYKEKIQAKLERFKKSGAAQLGTRRAEDTAEDRDAGFFDLTSLNSWVVTKAFWVNTPKSRRLALYRRHKTVEVEPYGPANKDADKINDIPVPVDKDVAAKREKADETANPFEFWKYVPREFESAVVQMHEAQWHAAPVQHESSMTSMVAYLSEVQNGER